MDFWCQGLLRLIEFFLSVDKMYAQEFSLGSCSIKKHRDGARHFFIDHPASILFGIHLLRSLN